VEQDAQNRLASSFNFPRHFLPVCAVRLDLCGGHATAVVDFHSNIRARARREHNNVREEKTTRGFNNTAGGRHGMRRCIIYPALTSDAFDAARTHRRMVIKWRVDPKKWSPRGESERGIRSQPLLPLVARRHIYYIHIMKAAHSV